MSTNLPKKHLTYSIRDFYKNYKKEVKDTNFSLREYTKYRDYIYDIFAEVFKHVLTEGLHFVMPYSLGEFYLKELKKLSGKRVAIPHKSKYTFNNHTLRKTFKFDWDRTYAGFPTAQYYKFQILKGDEKMHRRYGVGRKVISDFLFSVGRDPKIKVPNPINYAVRKPQELKNDSH